jgi:hypothetical protein
LAWRGKAHRQTLEKFVIRWRWKKRLALNTQFPCFGFSSDA